MNSRDDTSVSMRGNETFSRRKLIEILIVIVLTGTTIFVAISQDWIGTTKKGAVDTVRVDKAEEQIKEIRVDYVRKESLEPRLAALEKQVEQLRQERIEDSRKIDMILFEVRRK